MARPYFKFGSMPMQIPIRAEVIPQLEIPDLKPHHQGIATVIAQTQLDRRKPLRGCEIGVHTAETSVFVLNTLPYLHLLAVDFWAMSRTNGMFARSSGERCAESENIARQALEPFADRVDIIKANSAEALAQMPSDLDFVYIDADHSYLGVRTDVRNYAGALGKDGILIGHDYGSRRFWEVTLLVNWLIEACGWPVKTIGATEIWYVTRREIDEASARIRSNG